MTVHRRHLMKAATFLLFALSCICVQAVQVEPSTKIIRITGTISEKLVTSIRLKLIGFQNTDPFPAGLIVLLDSNGGDGEAAMEIGRMLRQYNAHVFVSNRCDSACVFLFMGGVVRAALPGTLGVHAGRLVAMEPDGRVTKEVDASKSLANSFQLAEYNRNIRLYLQEMGISHGILDVILAHPTRDVYKLTSADMSEYRVIGFDNRYLEQRIRYLDKMGETGHINRIELYNRTMSVPKLCRPSGHSDPEFISCYKSVLEGHK